VPPTTYGSVEPKLFDRIVEQTAAGPEKTSDAADGSVPMHHARD